MEAIDRLKKWLAAWYYSYLVHTALYMLEPWERTIFNSLLIAFLAMASYTTYLFLPGHLNMLRHFWETFWAGSYDTGSSLVSNGMDSGS